MSLANVRYRLMSMIEYESAMVVSTVNKLKMVPWSATVYFFYNNGLFYFFSSSESRHIVESMNTNTVAVSIYSQAISWSDIRGVQMSGTVKEISGIMLIKKILSGYLSKFNFVRDMPNSFRKSCDITELLRAGKGKFIKLYGFRPDKVLYSDNHFGFGFREDIELT